MAKKPPNKDDNDCLDPNWKVIQITGEPWFAAWIDELAARNLRTTPQFLAAALVRRLEAKGVRWNPALPEERPRRRLRIGLPPDLYELTQQIAASENVTHAELCREALLDLVREMQIEVPDRLVVKPIGYQHES